MFGYVDYIYSLSEAFEKQAMLSEEEKVWLNSTKPKYHRPTPSAGSASEVAQGIKENPLNDWSINGIQYSIKLLEQKIRSGKLQRKDVSRLVKAVDFFKKVLREI